MEILGVIIALVIIALPHVMLYFIGRETDAMRARRHESEREYFAYMDRTHKDRLRIEGENARLREEIRLKL